MKDDIKIIFCDDRKDNRGSGSKIYHEGLYSNFGVKFKPLEIMTIHSKKNVLRGIHYQKKYGQNKVIVCVQGKLFLVAVCIDKSNNNYGEYLSYEINGPSKIVYIPESYAIGTLALRDSDFMVLCGNNLYMPEYESGIMWNDKKININWPINTSDFIISEKDNSWPYLL